MRLADLRVCGALLTLSALLLSSPEPLAAQSGRTGRIEGTIVDSVGAGPLVGATVTASRTGAGTSPRVATTDAKGRFQFEQLEAGSYAVGFSTSLLDSLAYVPVHQLDVQPERTTVASLATPSAATLQAMACPGVTLPQGAGALFGVVTDAETERPLGSATVAVAWNERVLDPGTKALTTEMRQMRARTDAAGGYLLCGVPTHLPLVLQVQHDSRAGSVLHTQLAGRVGLQARNLSFSAAAGTPMGDADSASAAPAPAGTATVSGTVRGAQGEPLSGAALRIAGTMPVAHSDAAGQYQLTGLPAGTHDLEVRRLGYLPERRAVELRTGRTTRVDLVLERAISLDSVRVVAQRMRFPEFEMHKTAHPFGSFLDGEEIARRKFRTLPHIMGTVSGFKLVSGLGGELRVARARESGCVQTGLLGLATRPELNIVIDNQEFRDIADVDLANVAAIEAYPFGNEAPWRYRQACAVIVIWTKNWGNWRAAHLATPEGARNPVPSRH